MFDALSERFEGIFSRLRSRGRLSERDVAEVTREIRLALLEADVNVRVVKDLVGRVKDRASGAEGSASLSPAQQVVKIVNEELVATLGGVTGKLTMSSQPPTVVMLAGLQGSGKTTAAGKLARHLKSQGLGVLLVAADLQRPAAVEQLRVLGRRLDVPVFSAPEGARWRAVDVAAAAREEAARLGRNVVVVDTAGRLQVDADLMDELRQVREVLAPHNTLLVVDAMTGQEAVNVAVAFDEAVSLDGVILTKIDGDARGGAALSVKEVVGRPILFVGTGEKPEDFEPFHPDRMAGRILGMGDVLTLIEKAESAFDEEQVRETEQRLRKGQFTLDDFLDQMRQVRKMGPLQNLVKMMPGLPKELKSAQVDESELARVEAIICSMTPRERREPSLINGSRRLRIARGSGTTTADVNALLKQFKMVQQMMRSVAKGKKPRLPVPGM
ncbi:MAG: signal recognition particle protein [Acidimicrobiia bacterium]|nr:signal recognition particle protein [Acidimicrobiia bacterium]